MPASKRDDEGPSVIISPDLLGPGRAPSPRPDRTERVPALDRTDKTPMPWDGPERRAYPRKHAGVRATWRPADVRGEPYLEVELFNLSEGGLFAASDDPPAPGTRIEVRLQLPGASEAVVAQGRVARIVLPAAQSPDEPPGFAVQFIDVRLLPLLVQYLRRVPASPPR